MKKIIKYISVCLLMVVSIFLLQNVPTSSNPKRLDRLADTSNIRRNLEAIINTSDYRNFMNDKILDSVATYIRSELMKNTDRVSIQKFKVKGKYYSNIIASFGPQRGEKIIVGAHYDVCLDQDGADDNASGVAGLMELGKLLSKQDLTYPVELVAYTLEEPPFFDTENMGSYVHAKSLSDSKAEVKGMICLEMIGYYSNQAHSQQYPFSPMEWLYGNRGDYITIIQKSFGGSFSRQFKKFAFKDNSILTKSLVAPSFFGGIDLSDHTNYWKFGYSAVMITNTAFYRNPYYHQRGDKLVTLDIPKIGLVVDGVFRVLKDFR